MILTYVRFKCCRYEHNSHSPVLGATFPWTVTNGMLQPQRQNHRLSLLDVAPSLSIYVELLILLARDNLLYGLKPNSGGVTLPTSCLLDYTRESALYLVKLRDKPVTFMSKLMDLVTAM